jgi:arylsulfatase A-like enzyme
MAIAMALIPAVAADKPNIVFILADDMSYDSVSANNPKIGPMKTPHIDRLISRGMNFTDAHSGSAVCTPTRYGLLTGRYCWRTKLKKEVLWDWGAPLIEPERLTVAEMLKAQGYSTGMIGKWHLGLTWYGKDGKPVNDNLQLRDATWRPGAGAERLAQVEKSLDFTKATTGGPNDHGFDYWFGVDVPNFPPYCWMENGKTVGIPSVPKPKKMFGTNGPMLPGWKLEHILAGLGDAGAAWIGKQSKDKPFFLYVPLTSPHTPISPSAKFQGKSGISPYVDFVMETDHVVGQLMEALDKADATDNTLVIFSTDNGTSAAGAKFPQLEKHGIDLHHHFKGHKAQIHEGGHRVPFVARWPGKIKPGSTCQETVGLNDFMATVADILDVALPDNAAEDSFSILPLLTGEKTALPDRPSVINHDYGGRFAIRKGKWKLVPGKAPALFDLDADPKESKNIAKAHPEVVQEMTATLERYKTSGRSR